MKSKGFAIFRVAFAVEYVRYNIVSHCLLEFPMSLEQIIGVLAMFSRSLKLPVVTCVNS